MAGRNPFGIALGDALMQPDVSIPPIVTQQIAVPSPQAPPAPQSRSMVPEGMSKGQFIMGIIADALAGAAGKPGGFAQMLNQRRQAEQEEVQWGRRREAEMQDYGRKLEMQNDPRYAKPESRYWEDNAGNQWKMGANGQPERFFTDMAPKQYIQDGMLVTAPNPYNVGAPSVAPPVITEDLWNKGTPIGGSTPQASGGFPATSYGGVGGRLR